MPHVVEEMEQDVLSKEVHGPLLVYCTHTYSEGTVLHFTFIF